MPRQKKVSMSSRKSYLAGYHKGAGGTIGSVLGSRTVRTPQAKKITQPGNERQDYSKNKKSPSKSWNISFGDTGIQPRKFF